MVQGEVGCWSSRGLGLGKGCRKGAGRAGRRDGPGPWRVCGLQPQEREGGAVASGGFEALGATGCGVQAGQEQKFRAGAQDAGVCRDAPGRGCPPQAQGSQEPAPKSPEPCPPHHGLSCLLCRGRQPACFTDELPGFRVSCQAGKGDAGHPLAHMHATHLLQMIPQVLVDGVPV